MLTNMPTELLRTLVAVVDLRSFTKVTPVRSWRISALGSCAN
jgi:hypothetical protein